MKNRHENKFEKYVQSSTIKAQEWHVWDCSGIFIINFKDVCIENPVKHMKWGLSAKKSYWRKAKVFKGVVNTGLKFEEISYIVPVFPLSTLNK